MALLSHTVTDLVLVRVEAGREYAVKSFVKVRCDVRGNCGHTITEVEVHGGSCGPVCS